MKGKKMKTRIFILAIVVLVMLAIGAFAQPPDTLWTRTFGGGGNDYGRSVQQTSDGGYIIAGYTESFGAGNSDVYLVKTDVSGIRQWQQTFGGTSFDQGYSVQQTFDGGYIVTGYTFSYGAGYQDVWLIKTEANGDTVWTQTFGEDMPDEGCSVQQTTDGGYIVTGFTYSNGTVSYDVYLIKTDANGDTVWTRALGGSDDEWGNSVQQTSDGGYIIAGYNFSWTTFDVDIYLIKTDAIGDTIWTRTYGGSNDDKGYSVQQTSDGGYIIAGKTSSYGAGSSDVWLIKTDANGDTVWTRTFGGDLSDIGKSVQQTENGGYIIVGYIESYPDCDIYLIKTDSNGNRVWTCTFGGSEGDFGHCVQQTSEGGYIIAGSTISFGAGFADVYLIRLEGEEPSEVSIILTPENPPIQIPAGGGSFNFGLEIDNGTINNYTIDVATNVTLPGGTIYPILTRYNINLASGATITRNLTQFVPAGAPSGNYTYNGYVYDHTTWEILADDSFPFEKLAGDGLPNHNLGWALYGWDDESAPAASLPTEYAMISAYPNPFNPSTTISFEIRDAGFVNLTIYDITGREVAKLVDGLKPAGSHQVTFDGSDLSSGIYFARLTAGEFTRTQKLLLIK